MDSEDRQVLRHDLPDDEDSVAIARTIIAVGHQLQMDVVAEGVETPEQALAQGAGLRRAAGLPGSAIR